LHANIACGVQNVNRIKSVKCTSILGIEENQMQSLQVFPNPTTHLLNIANYNTIDSVALYNMLGQLVKQQTMQSKTGTIDMSAFAAGTYFARVFSGNTSKTLKVIKE
jgi:surface polysaccharide O-acyltransferase-like enzyme